MIRQRQLRYGRRRSARRAAVSPPRAAAGGALAALVRAQQSVLTASAMSGGLAAARPRSPPERLVSEARQFVTLLTRALAARTEKDVGEMARQEVRNGSVAAAEPDDVLAVFGIWRRALQASLPAIGAEGGARLSRVLELLEDRCAAAARGWAAERIDVVAVGASAGGITALGTLLANLDPTFPATVLVVVHLSSRAPSLLPAVLKRASRLALAAAVDGGALSLGHAFVAPPGRHLVVRSGLMRLVDGPPVHFVKPSVDVLFESAAEAFGRRLASVVLTGTGADGATGTRAVRDHGGATFAQDPETAEFRGMPEAASATGAVDHVLPLGALAGALDGLVSRGRAAVRS